MTLKNRLLNLEMMASAKEYKKRKVIIVCNGSDQDKINKYRNSGHPLTIIKRRRSEG